MRPEEVTAQILSAWDEIEPTLPSAEEPEPETEEEQPGEEVEQPETEEATPPQEEEAEPEEEGEGEGEQEAEPAEEEGEEPDEAALFESDDPEIRAFLAKFQGDTEKALRYGISSQHALSRQGQEKQALERRVRELESELQQANAFSDEATILNEAQRNWLGEAIESGNPAAYVREAARAGEFGLARAICTEWGHEQPYDALRAMQQVEAAEASFYAAVEAEQPVASFTAEQLLSELSTHFPDMPNYAAQMTATIAQLGDMHPLVIDARSQNPDEAVRGVMGIYEIARASTHSLSSAKQELRNGNREKASSAKRKAVVASGTVSPSPGETPTPRRIGPGLTLEQLEEEWARNT